MACRVFLLLLLGITIFSGCTLTKPQEGPPPFDPELFRIELDALPGAVVVEGEGITLTYPGETLFGKGSALPFPGGTAVLDPLVRLIIKHRDVVCVGSVRAESGLGEGYDRALAEKRRELLVRFFTSRGITERRLPLSIAAGKGAPFELKVETPHYVPGSSSAEKR